MHESVLHMTGSLAILSRGEQSSPIPTTMDAGAIPPGGTIAKVRATVAFGMTPIQPAVRSTLIHIYTEALRRIKRAAFVVEELPCRLVRVHLPDPLRRAIRRCLLPQIQPARYETLVSVDCILSLKTDELLLNLCFQPSSTPTHAPTLNPVLEPTAPPTQKPTTQVHDVWFALSCILPFARIAQYHLLFLSSPRTTLQGLLRSNRPARQAHLQLRIRPIRYATNQI